ncbi:lipid-A-disaccharide synthase [Fluviicola taffensis]|uniref:Lipid-A-disaccharide synthase n=1 Tax=Fluviicola taffensis (strain DSM 16823 / NCIMB 13979 / RW262) TaxID=755732 RepID=F2IBB3_FLUTR|nr:lipid-A-disaccharide synthase [Fluviicola taffensis]AEA43199.1 lipid-A-disaccharide synthase [Fluviicola taffensis DSM 16823]
MGRKLYIISGEASGDLHGANVMKELLAQEPDLDIRFWGGDKMQAVGGTMAKHIRELAFMGFVEVLMNLPTILRNIRFCKKDIQEFKPDAILLIDYPGFNMRIAEWAKKNELKVYFYISPTVWAWKENRVHKIKRDVYKLFCILPFEADFYKKYNYDVEYVGHPLLDEIEQYQQLPKQELTIASHEGKPIIAMLPGSRKQELRTKLPVMLPLVDLFPQYHFVIAGAPNMDIAIYKELIGDKKVDVVYGQTYPLLQQSEAAVVTSGTATLETGLFEIPEVVCYIGNSISYQIAKRLVNVKYISLVNLILDKESVVELIQNECTTDRLAKELSDVIVGGKKREQVLEDYKQLKNMLGKGGASKKVAQSVLKTI